jgi:hypothetical protein
MKYSNFKSIVKDSIREAFYTKKTTLNEALVGYKLYVTTPATFGVQTLKGIITKNTILYEHEYRLTLFKEVNGEEIAQNHYQLSKKDLDNVLQTKDLTPKIKRQLSNRYFCPVSSIKMRFVDEFDEFDEVKKSLSINEKLFLMEESVRELELFIDNKQPT